ncbi:MAG: hypothetical protein JXR30_02775 [Alphaproteobacteria bacterium]|nr:hypothetical protein [Alphaproteobacteria bacterium]
MKKTILFTSILFFAIQASAFVVKKKEESKDGKKQTVVIACEDLKGKETKKVFKLEREQLGKTWKSWSIVGKGGKFKTFEDAAKDICTKEDLK